jgi:hypothetical protein
MQRTAVIPDRIADFHTSIPAQRWVEMLRPALYSLVILWINAYVCRAMFFASTTYMGSMHGFWAQKSFPNLRFFMPGSMTQWANT